HQIQVMTLLRSTGRAGHGVVVVLHDLALAARYCDRLVLLAHQGIIAEGAPAAVLTDAHIREAYAVEVVRGEHAVVPFLLPWRSGAAGEGRSEKPAHSRAARPARPSYQWVSFLFLVYWRSAVWSTLATAGEGWWSLMPVRPVAVSRGDTPRSSLMATSAP